MNYKKLLTIFFLLTLVAIPIMSQNIFGTWMCISSVDVVEGKEINGYMKGQYLTVNADGTYSSTSAEMGYGRFTLQGNSFKAKNNNGASFNATISVNGNQLTMEGTSSYGASFYYTFERIEEIDIVGTWMCISSVDVVEGKEINGYMKGQYLTVNADGTYGSTSEEMGYGRFTLQGNSFTAKNNNGASFNVTISVNGNQLTMEGTSSYGASFYYVFEKYGKPDEPVEPDEPADNNKCGENVYFSYDKTTHTLTISGYGEMNNYSYYEGECSPWHEYRNNIQKVVIESGVTSIGSYAFYDCENMASVTIPNSVTAINNSAFSQCIGLASVYISSLEAWCNIKFRTYFDIEIFDFKDINVTSNPLSRASHFYLNGEEIKELVIPDNVSSINNGTFAYCNCLTSVTIPNSVTSIGELAFFRSSIKSVTIGNNVETIGAGAFLECRNLTSLTLGKSVKRIGAYSFSMLDLSTIISMIEDPSAINIYKAFNWSNLEKPILFVPLGTIDKYRKANGWGEFKNIVEFNPSGIQSIETGKNVDQIFSLRGDKIKAPHKGINIIKYKDGKIEKVLIK